MTEKFHQLPNLPLESKYLIINLLFISNDYTISKAIFDHTMLVYNNPNITDFLHNLGIYRFDENSNNIILNKDILKSRFGIYLRKVKETKTVDVDFNKVFRLLIAYNSVRDLHYVKKGLSKMPPIFEDPKKYGSYGKMIKFLEKYKIDNWYLYYYTLFSTTKWETVWGVLSYGAKQFDMYTNKVSSCMGEIANNAVNIKQSKDKWLDIFDLVELRKKKHLEEGKPELCLNNLEYTLGYHPKSSFCTSCPLQVECINKIRELYKSCTKSNVDIVEYRGKI